MSTPSRPPGRAEQDLHPIEAELLLASSPVTGPEGADPGTSTRSSDWREADGRLPEASSAPDGAWETAVRTATSRLVAWPGRNPAQVLADELAGAGLFAGLNPQRYLRDVEELRDRQSLLAGSVYFDEPAE